MLKILTHTVTAVVFLAIGVWYGYDKALMNQIYYDAPAKITLYDAVLEDGSAEDFLLGNINLELNNLEWLKNEVSPILLNHPTHEGMLEVFQEHEPQIEALPRVIMAREFMQTYNNTRNEMDGSDESPVR